MLYVVSVLHLPSGDTKSGYVVDVTDGIVKEFYPFDKERPAMLYLQEVYISSVKDAGNACEMSVNDNSDRLYAYIMCGNGQLSLLK